MHNNNNDHHHKYYSPSSNADDDQMADKDLEVETITTQHNHDDRYYPTQASQDASKEQYSEESLDAVPLEHRTWKHVHFAAMWAALSLSISTYMMGSGMLSTGLNWWQSVVTIFLGNLITIGPLLLNSHAGTKYGIPFPVFARASFGNRGAILAALARGIVGVGWFGFQCVIGGKCLYLASVSLIPQLRNTLYLGKFMNMNLWQLICYVVFILSNILIVIVKGIAGVRVLEIFAAPLLLVSGVALFIWALVAVQFKDIIAATHQMQGHDPTPFGLSIWVHLTAVIGGWSTMILNILDFTRYSRSQKDQVIGQVIGLPLVMTGFAFIGICTTGAAYHLHGRAIWDPVDLIATFQNKYVVSIACIILAFAITAGNLTANLISAANDFCNLKPDLISFRIACCITAVLSVIIVPWKLFANAEGFIFVFLIGSSGLLGTVGGVMIADYFILRKTELSVDDLYQLLPDSQYYYSLGFCVPALLSCTIAMLPIIPGFLYRLGVTSLARILPRWILSLYDYAWFISIVTAAVLYLLMQWIWKKFPRRNAGAIRLQNSV